MTEKTLTRLDLAEALRRDCGVRKEDGTKLVEDVLECIMRGLVEDGEVKLSSFATFTVTTKPPRVGRNPKTGEEQPISARKVVRFRASHRMKSLVAGK
jgi:integration host factor subunit alpha